MYCTEFTWYVVSWKLKNNDVSVMDAHLFLSLTVKEGLLVL